MLISLPEIIQKYNLNIKGVIQVGAHFAEEHEIYQELGIGRMFYIEPCLPSFMKMQERLFEIKKDEIITIYHGGCSDEKKEVEMFVSDDNEGQSNSILQPNLHLQQHPEVRFNHKSIINVNTLDKIIDNKDDFNLLTMDVQGAEGLVLKGATETLKHIDCIYTEVNRGQTYEGNMEIDEMDEYLSNFGFVRVETYWPSPSWTWGDAVYISYELDYYYKTGIRLNP